MVRQPPEREEGLGIPDQPVGDIAQLERDFECFESGVRSGTRARPLFCGSSVSCALAPVYESRRGAQTSFVAGPWLSAFFVPSSPYQPQYACGFRQPGESGALPRESEPQFELLQQDRGRSR